MSNTSEEDSYLNDIQNEYILSELEQDALGEIGNICMGTAATTLSTLLNNKVSITTPRVSICRTVKELGNYQKPFVTVEVSYTEGIGGYNILFIKEDDVMAITDILMGGDGKVDTETEIDEIHFSAISEVMNQMVGSSSTALSNILKKPVNISPPMVRQILLDDDAVSQLANGNEATVKISFVMKIEGILTSDIMQIMPFNLAKKLANTLIDDMMSNSEPDPAPSPKHEPENHAENKPISQAVPVTLREPNMMTDKNRIGVKAVQYQSFDAIQGQQNSGSENKENLDFIMDVPLQVTVELGRCKKTIKEILGFNVGSVIVLDRLAGEMVDILVNGKLFAKGEVVVIDDSYGVRVTDIISMPQG